MRPKVLLISCNTYLAIIEMVYKSSSIISICLLTHFCLAGQTLWLLHVASGCLACMSPNLRTLVPHKEHIWQLKRILKSHNDYGVYFEAICLCVCLSMRHNLNHNWRNSSEAVIAWDLTVVPVIFSVSPVSNTDPWRSVAAPHNPYRSVRIESDSRPSPILPQRL